MHNQCESKVGIMTFWSSNDNYGQLLQVFALSTIIEKFGLSVFIIKYDGIADKTLKQNSIKRLLNVFLTPSRIKNFILRKFKEQKLTYIPVINNSLRNFDKFRKDHLKFSPSYTTYRELEINPPIADMYICGSDMIWTSQNKMKPYFLQFVPKNAIKIAYAPSFGRKNIDLEYRKDIIKAVSNFQSLSIREASGKEIFDEMGINTCQHVPDPTLLLTANDYVDKLGIKNSTKRYNRLFAYILGNESSFSSEICDLFCQKYALDYIYTSAHNRKDDYHLSYPTIEQWVENIATSQYFITNSFHGCIFALLFKTPFIFYPLTGVKKENNERIYSLLEKFRLENRIFTGNIDILFKPIDFEAVDSRLKEWRKEGIDFLTEALLSSLYKK